MGNEILFAPLQQQASVFHTQVDVDTIGDLYRAHSLLYKHAKALCVFEKKLDKMNRNKK
jgi:hypothetical protein